MVCLRFNVTIGPNWKTKLQPKSLTSDTNMYRYNVHVQMYNAHVRSSNHCMCHLLQYFHLNNPKIYTFYMVNENWTAPHLYVRSISFSQWNLIFGGRWLLPFYQFFLKFIKSLLARNTNGTTQTSNYVKSLATGHIFHRYMMKYSSKQNCYLGKSWRMLRTDTKPGGTLLFVYASLGKSG